MKKNIIQEKSRLRLTYNPGLGIALTEQQQQQQQKYTLYLPSALSVIAQVLVGLNKQLKQMSQIEHNIVKNPNWPEANQLAIYKRGRQPG